MGAPMGNRNAAGSRGGSKGSRWKPKLVKSRYKTIAQQAKAWKPKLVKKKNSALSMSPKAWMAMKAASRKK